mmetsp:Transcript_1465/g.4603  ORF Transcript_1465/g.4603 Transcript_1465/m.4603 type:complete len:245 (+) Transcript_1465:348-1082(+)
MGDAPRQRAACAARRSRGCATWCTSTRSHRKWWCAMTPRAWAASSSASAWRRAPRLSCSLLTPQPPDGSGCARSSTTASTRYAVRSTPATALTTSPTTPRAQPWSRSTVWSWAAQSRRCRRRRRQTMSPSAVRATPTPPASSAAAAASAFAAIVWRTPSATTRRPCRRWRGACRRAAAPTRPALARARGRRVSCATRASATTCSRRSTSCSSASRAPSRRRRSTRASACSSAPPATRSSRPTGR